MDRSFLSGTGKKGGSRMAIKRMTQDLAIENGPGVWDMILSLFEGKPVYFTFEEAGREFNRHPFVITGVNFHDDDREQCNFRTVFPAFLGEQGGFGTDGFINLKTRKGSINSTVNVTRRVSRLLSR